MKPIEWAAGDGEVHILNLRPDEISTLMAVLGMIQRRRWSEPEPQATADRQLDGAGPVSLSQEDGQ
jgi:hypothetical protein